MTRPVHAFGGMFGTACGVSLSRSYADNDLRFVTCKRCLKLIGAQQPSGAATDRVSAVKPVERRATVAATDSPPTPALGWKMCSLDDAARNPVKSMCRVRINGTWHPWVEFSKYSGIADPEDYQFKTLGETDASRCARLEKLLRGVVEAWDKAASGQKRGTVWRTETLESAIEAARRETP